MIEPSDESFHAYDADDPWWTETSWFGFNVPERRLSGTIYTLIRPTVGVCSGTVYVWDDSAELPWEVLYGRALHHLPMPQGDLTDLTVANGLRLRCEMPLQRHTLAYDDGSALAFDLTFDAVAEPHRIGPQGDIGHFDQPGRMTGWLTLRGERLDIDCVSLRDRSWSPRSDLGGFGAGYSYAFTADRGFHVVAVRRIDADVVAAGFLVRDGRTTDIVGGARRVERVDGRPVRVTIEASDAEGRTLSASGECVNRFAFPAYPGNLTWMSLTRWTLDTGDVWGEDQDIWTPDLWREYRSNR